MNDQTGNSRPDTPDPDTSSTVLLELCSDMYGGDGNDAAKDAANEEGDGGFEGLAAELGSRLVADDAVRVLEAVQVGFAAGGVGRLKLRGLAGTRGRAGAPQRFYDAELRFGFDASGMLRVWLSLQDLTEKARLAQALEDARAAHELALTVLRAEPRSLRMYVDSASATLQLVQSLLRMPARAQSACRQKLERMSVELRTLAEQARQLGLQALAASAATVIDRIGSIRSQMEVSGDDMLPLSVLLDAVFARLIAVRDLVDQRRESQPSNAADEETLVDGEDWPALCRRDLNALVQRLAAGVGREARLELDGVEQLPEPYQQNASSMLAHLLRNAVEHGIEPPADRERLGKPRTGRISVVIREIRDAGNIDITVEDDGRGFDVARIGRIAVENGLVTREELEAMDPRRVIGLIFRPGFTTAGVSGCNGRGLGMEFLRELVTRLDGQIAVATKARRYTRFRITLPPAPKGSRDLSVPLNDVA